MSLNVYSNGALSKICGNFIVDSVLSKTSNNAIANAPVATKFEEIEQQMGSQDFTGTTAEVQAAIQAGTIDDDTIVYITDDSQESSVTASDITYDDGTVSGTTVQDALENTAGKFYATEAAAESDLANIEDGQMVYTDDGEDELLTTSMIYHHGESLKDVIDDMDDEISELSSIQTIDNLFSSSAGTIQVNQAEIVGKLLIFSLQITVNTNVTAYTDFIWINNAYLPNSNQLNVPCMVVRGSTVSPTVANIITTGGIRCQRSLQSDDTFTLHGMYFIS